ncbi:MAG: sensor histidine kinase [Lachnospiraceae bacterium]|jgi:two-component system sensor histidine kinase VanS
MKNSLKWKTIIAIVTMVLLALIVGLCLCFAFSNKFYVSIKQKSLINVYNQVNSMYSKSDSISRTLVADEDYIKLSTMCEENIISMLVMNPAGGTDFSFGNSSMLYSHLNDIMLSPEKSAGYRVIEHRDNYTLVSYTASAERRGYLEIWGILDNGNFIIARSSYAGIANSVSVSLMFFCIVCAVVFVVVSVFIFIIIRPYTDSLNRLLIFAQKTNKGEFETEFDAGKRRANDEIGLLGDAINEISRKLEKAIAELKTTNLKLERELREKTIQEEAYKKYMSDVSHELKTPIALISGYAEGIREGISDNPEDRDYYCNIIIDEADRMNLMIKRLATLNQIEHGSTPVNLERFNVIEVIDGFLNTMAIVIEEQGANIYFKSVFPIYVWSDEFLFEEILVNYFNNALNHMNEEKIIRIDASYKGDETVRVTVFNSGSHIPEDEMDKIWSQFYKVDQARTRQYGGSGLGLSIVKAIAQILGQECGVYNTEGGVAFWIELEGVKRDVRDL